jgi:hypothetical protein
MLDIMKRGIERNFRGRTDVSCPLALNLSLTHSKDPHPVKASLLKHKVGVREKASVALILNLEPAIVATAV